MRPAEQFRLFVALSVPDEVKDQIEHAQTEMAGKLPHRAARWTRREQFHLTLRFLGNVPIDRLEDLVQAGRAACQRFRPLRLTARGVDFFPNPRIARVLWIGITDQQNQLADLWKAIQAATQPFCQTPSEPDFTGHVTLARLGRLSRSQADELANAAAEWDCVTFGTWTAQRVALMRSELLPEGARHSVLAEFPLEGRDEGMDL